MSVKEVRRLYQEADELSQCFQDPQIRVAAQSIKEGARHLCRARLNLRHFQLMIAPVAVAALFALFMFLFTSPSVLTAGAVVGFLGLEIAFCVFLLSCRVFRKRMAGRALESFKRNRRELETKRFVKSD